MNRAPILIMAVSLLAWMAALATQAAPVKFTADGNSICVASDLVTATCKSVTYDNVKNIIVLEGTAEVPVNLRTTPNEDGSIVRARARKMKIEFDPLRFECKGVFEYQKSNVPNSATQKSTDGKAAPLLPSLPVGKRAIAVPSN